MRFRMCGERGTVMKQKGCKADRRQMIPERWLEDSPLGEDTMKERT